MDHDLVDCQLDLPDAYASALEYVAAKQGLTQGELVVFLMQCACMCQLDGELLEVGKELYQWLTLVKKVPTEEVSL